MPFCVVHGVRIYYAVFGQGVPIVFIAPPVVGNSVFHHQIVPLSSEHRIILFDLRGHGKSDPSDRKVTYSVIVEDIRCLLEHLQLDKVILCGYSMGGSIALEFIRTHPDRTMGAMVVSGFSEVSDIRLRTEISAAVALAKLRAMRTLAFGLALANADSYLSFRRMFTAGQKSNRKDVQALFEYALAYNCTSALPQLKQPIRLMFGSKDKRLQRYIKVLQKYLPNKEIFFVPHVSHQIPPKAHLTFNDALKDFVAECKNTSDHKGE